MSATAAILASFATFAVGFFARPVGGIVISHFGDRFGRKPALIFTIALMGLSTVAMGLLPTFAQAGVLAPVLLVRGEYDGIATVADLEEFYNKLPNGDRQFVILPGTAHSVALAINRQLFWHVTRAFLTMPPPIAT